MQKLIRLHYMLFPISLILLLTACGGPAVDEKSSEAIPVAYTEAEVRDLSVRREVTAPVVAYKRIYITARTGGLIEEVAFEEGDQIRAGDLLARMDTRRQKAQLRKVRATLQQIQKSYNRTKQLYENDVIPEAEFEAIARELEETKAEAHLWEVEVDLGQIHAPIDAIVSDRLIEVGTTVSENQRLFTIEDHKLLVIRPGLSESDVVHLEKGQEVKLGFDIFPGDTLKGNIRRIFPAADPLTRLFTVEVEIDQAASSRRIYPGYLARLHFVTQQRDNVLAIPPESLITEEEEAFVFVIIDERVTRRRVETGIRRDGWVEIISGLEAGEKVAAANLENLDEDSPVEVHGRFRRHGFRD